MPILNLKYKKFFQLRPMYINSFALNCVEYILNNLITYKVERLIQEEIE